jgi:phosphatidylglycerol:prolipoprotein diacylglycerol transferase
MASIVDIGQQLSRIFAGLGPTLAWATALTFALAYATRAARRENLEARSVYWAGVIGIIGGLWGGHLLGMYYYGSDGRPWAWLRFWAGGQAQYGGLVAGTLAIAVFAMFCRLSFPRLADALAPATALGVAIGRVGCFLNGDDFGSVSHLPWAVQFPPGTEAYNDHLVRGWITSADAWSLHVHPVQLYCTVIWLVIFGILLGWRGRIPGQRFALFMMIHGAGRMVEQMFRGDFQPVLGLLSLTQLISLALVLAGGCLWIALFRLAREKHRKTGIAVMTAA